MDAGETNKPSFLNFAGVMLILMGFFQLVSAIEFFRNLSWVKEFTGGMFGEQLVIWCIIDLLVCLAAGYGGYSILKELNPDVWSAWKFRQSVPSAGSR